jgi:TonB family protein
MHLQWRRRAAKYSCLRVSVRKHAVTIAAFVLWKAVLVLAISLPCAAQIVANEDSAPHIILSKLSPPTYPPLARQARVGGDVTIKLAIHADGSIESVRALNGHPMLVQAALESAKQSTFECRDCKMDSNVSEILTYSFQLSPPEPDPCCCSSAAASGNGAPVLHVSESGDHIVLTAAPGCTCPDRCTGAWAFQHAHFRSAKCLFLWKCGFHDYSVY